MNIYDFDGTIYDGDSSVDFFLFALKRNPSLIRFFPIQLSGIILYALGLIKKERCKEHFFSFLTAINTEEMVKLFWSEKKEKFFMWYLEQKATDDIIISASPEFLLIPICNELGIKRIIASKVNSKTGKFESKNCRGEEKVQRLRQEYDINEIDKFYSDSFSDLPLAKMSRKAFLVKKGVVTKWEAK